jgi:urease accessory protein
MDAHGRADGAAEPAGRRVRPTVNGAAALLLADARFPAGGHAHSGGVEPAASLGTVTGLGELELFLRGRLWTAGLTAAALAAVACAIAASESPATWDELDAEADARLPSPAQRQASRRQGRTLLRAAKAAWPEAGWLGRIGRQPHHAVALGATAYAAAATPGEAARIAAYQAVSSPASAAVRLLALDPMQAAAITARLAHEIDAVARQASRHEDGPLEDLPMASAPALDLLAEAHARAEVRLFES